MPSENSSMTSDPAPDSAEGQARRLEAVYQQMAALLSDTRVAQRLRAAGPDEWSAVEIVGHMTELIPHWLHDAQTLIAASGDPPAFCRNLDAPERLEAVQRAATSDPDELLRALD